MSVHSFKTWFQCNLFIPIYIPSIVYSLTSDIQKKGGQELQCSKLYSNVCHNGSYVFHVYLRISTNNFYFGIIYRCGIFNLLWCWIYVSFSDGFFGFLRFIFLDDISNYSTSITLWFSSFWGSWILTWCKNTNRSIFINAILKIDLSFFQLNQKKVRKLQ